MREVKRMENALTEKDIEDGKRISELFKRLSEGDKNMAIAYLSALGDKAIADSSKELVKV